MPDDTPVVTTTPETPDTVLSQLQQQLADTSAELAKAANKAQQQEGRARKAEAALKSKQTEEEQQASDLSQKLEAAEQDRQQLKEKLTLLERDQTRSAVVAAVSAVASKLALGADKALTKLLNIDVTVDDKGQTIVRNDEGQRRINAKTGKPMTIEELRDEYLTQDFLLASKVQGGKGAKGNSDATPVDLSVDQVEKLTPKELADRYKELTPEQRATLREKAGR